jgi:hypothetical protein
VADLTEGSSSRRSSLGDGQVTPIRLSTVEEPREGPRLERVAEDGSFKGEQEIVSTPGEPSVAAPQSPEGEAGTSEEPAQSAAQTMVGRMMSTLLMRSAVDFDFLSWNESVKLACRSQSIVTQIG